MKLKDYLEKLDQQGRESVAKAAGTKAIYLYQIATEFRRASPLLAQRIEAATNRKVTRQDLRPDVYGQPKRRAA